MIANHTMVENFVTSDQLAVIYLMSAKRNLSGWRPTSILARLGLALFPHIHDTDMFLNRGQRLWQCRVNEKSDKRKAYFFRDQDGS
jgi:hypothetical protein